MSQGPTGLAADIGRAVSALLSACRPEDAALIARFQKEVAGGDCGAAQVARLSEIVCGITEPDSHPHADIFETLRDDFFLLLVQHAASTEAVEWLSIAIYNVTAGTDANAARRKDIFATEEVRGRVFLPLLKRATSGVACQWLAGAVRNITLGSDTGVACRRDIFATEEVRDGFFVLVEHATSAVAVELVSSAVCNITEGTDAGAARRRDIFATEEVRDGFFLPMAQHATSADSAEWLTKTMCYITDRDAGAARRRDIFATEMVRDGFFVALATHATSHSSSPEAVTFLAAAMCNITDGTDADAPCRMDMFAAEVIRDGFFVPLAVHATSGAACQCLCGAMCNITGGTDGGAGRRRDVFATETLRDSFFVPLVKHATSPKVVSYLSSAMCNITGGTDGGAGRRSDIFATETIRDCFFMPLVKHATSADSAYWLSAAMYNIIADDDSAAARRKATFATQVMGVSFFVPLLTSKILTDDCSCGADTSLAAADKLLSLLSALFVPTAPGRLLSAELVSAVLPFADFPATSDVTLPLRPALRTFLLEQHPLSSNAPMSTTVIAKDSQAFWDLEDALKVGINGHNDDYVKSRLGHGLLPITFVLERATAVSNPVLEKRFGIMKSLLGQGGGRSAKELRERCSFHGTHPQNIDGIVTTSLLPSGHPLNSCTSQSDDGWFGVNTGGVYVGRYLDYVLKYSNQGVPLQPDDEVEVIMFKTLPGKSKHIDKITRGLEPTPGFDSHSSPDFLEWYLFESAQLCPTHVLRIRAVVNNRTKADDGLAPH